MPNCSAPLLIFPSETQIQNPVLNLGKQIYIHRFQYFFIFCPMAPLQHCWHIKVFFLHLFLIFLTSKFISINSILVLDDDSKGTTQVFNSRRMLLDVQDEKPIIKKKSTPTTTNAISSKISPKNQTKLIKPTSNSSKNQTKLIKTTTSNEFKNQTKLIKLPIFDSTKNKTKLIKLPTSEDFIKDSPKSSKSNSTTRSNSLLTKKTSSDLSSSKNKTTNPTTTKTQLEKGIITEPKSKKLLHQQQQQQQQQQPSWIDEEDEDNFIADFRDLPYKFQETIVPDLETISKTSRSYLSKYNKEFTKGFKPYVGNKYAATIASTVSFAFIIIPLILVSLIFNRITAYFSIQKLLIFIQIYLTIYFTILCLSSLVTGLEPLRFFYSTSQSTYVCVQVLQTLAYVLYLLMLLMYLILVFSTETGLPTKMLGLGQTFVGFAVGLHYYISVFHRAVLHQPPKTSWKVHAVYATCFLVICLFGRVDSRKKAYLEEGGEEGKKS